MFGLGLPEFIIIFIILIFVFLPVYFTYKIVTKAGFSGLWAIVSLFPILNLIALWVFAFVDWPAET